MVTCFKCIGKQAAGGNKKQLCNGTLQLANGVTLLY